MFIPIGDDNRNRRRTPFVVLVLILCNAAVWYLELTKGERFVTGYSVIPYEVTHGRDLVGAKSVLSGTERGQIVYGPGPQPIYLTLVTAMFMHASWMHILGNMLYLWIFGDQIEDEFGHITFLIFYLFCGLVGSVAHIAIDPNSLIPSLGASGAISGVLGAYLVLHPRNSVRVLFIRTVVHLPALIVLGFWFALQLFGQFGTAGRGSSGVAYMAHIGGFVAGVAVIVALRAYRVLR